MVREPSAPNAERQPPALSPFPASYWNTDFGAGGVLLISFPLPIRNVKPLIQPVIPYEAV